MFLTHAVDRNPLLLNGNTPGWSTILLKPYRLAFRNFKQKIAVYIERGRLVIRTAEDGYDLEIALALRHDVFFRECRGRKSFIPFDVDRFDFICDHLIIEDQSSGMVIGAYRMNSSHFSDVFCAEREFHIDNIKRLPGEKLELGRACIHKQYRNGFIVGLLWRGVMEYLKKTRSRYLFGCSSVKTTDHTDISRLYKYFRDLYLASPCCRTLPRKRYKPRQPYLYQSNFIAEERTEAASYELVPPLLRSYLNAGAKICGEPAIDHAFKCADFFTLLDVRNLNEKVERRFNV